MMNLTKKIKFQQYLEKYYSQEQIENIYKIFEENKIVSRDEVKTNNEYEFLLDYKLEDLFVENKTRILDNVSSTFQLITIENLNFSVRTYNCLTRNKINNLYELTQLTEEELKQIRNLGHKCIKEIKMKFQEFRIKFKSSVYSVHHFVDDDEDDEEYIEDYDEIIEDKPSSAFLALPIEYLDLSMDTFECLNWLRINKISDLISKTENEMIETLDLSRKVVDEVIEKLNNVNLKLSGALIDDIDCIKENENIVINNEDINQESKKINIENEPIETLQLSVRAYNSLKRGNIHTIHELIQHNEMQLRKLRNFGASVLREVISKLSIIGLSLASNIKNEEEIDDLSLSLEKEDNVNNVLIEEEIQDDNNITLETSLDVVENSDNKQDIKNSNEIELNPVELVNTDDDICNLSLKDLNFSTEFIKELENINVYKISDLIEYTYDVIYNLENVTAKDMDHLVRLLKDHNLSLKEAEIIEKKILINGNIYSVTTDNKDVIISNYDKNDDTELNNPNELVNSEKEIIETIFNNDQIEETTVTEEELFKLEPKIRETEENDEPEEIQEPEDNESDNDDDFMNFYNSLRK